MSSGLAIVYSATGGVPELVGPDGGAGVDAPLDWEVEHPPAPALLAEAVQRVTERLPDHQQAARARAVERFDLKPWIDRHREVFETLLK
jgi:glycosyltransferase involved in cell wall biosynthesis